MKLRDDKCRLTFKRAYNISEFQCSFPSSLRFPAAVQRNVHETHGERGAGLEELVRVQDPLVVGAQQRAGALAGGEAHPGGHLGPALLFARRLEPALRGHDLKHTGVGRKLG